VQERDATATLSVASTVPVAGEVLNHPLLPLAEKVTATTGGVVSARLKFAVIVPVPFIVAVVDAENRSVIVIVPDVVVTLQDEKV
jgi:hypothetical protein